MRYINILLMFSGFIIPRLSHFLRFPDSISFDCSSILPGWSAHSSQPTMLITAPSSSIGNEQNTHRLSAGCWYTMLNIHLTYFHYEPFSGCSWQFISRACHTIHWGNWNFFSFKIIVIINGCLSVAVFYQDDLHRAVNQRCWLLLLLLALETNRIHMD